MSKSWFVVVLVCCFGASVGLICFNCSTTNLGLSPCAGEFAPPYLPFNATRRILANCSRENSMCYVRSWRARAKHAWIVQRGCYQSSGAEDTVPRLMDKPTRAMTCTKRRLADAEYRVCLCQSDWCNSASSIVISDHSRVYVGRSVLTLLLTWLHRRGAFLVDVTL